MDQTFMRRGGPGLRARAGAVFLLGMATLAARSQAPNSAGRDAGKGANTIQVSARGEARAEPDTAVVQWEIVGKNAAVKTAYAQAQAQAQQVRAILAQQGIAAAQAHWTAYQVQPDIDYRSGRVTDYTVTTSLELDLTDFHQLAPLLDAAGAAGLNALRNVSFELRNSDAAKASAIADGYHRARQEADALARAAGRQIEFLSSASVDVSLPGPIRPIMMQSVAAGGMAAPVADFTPSEITVSASVTAVFGLNP